MPRSEMLELSCFVPMQPVMASVARMVALRVNAFMVFLGLTLIKSYHKIL
ncbi:hypothetical protein [Moraxella lacunata]